MARLWRIYRSEKFPRQRVGRYCYVAHVRAHLPELRRTIRELNEMVGSDSVFGRAIRISHFVVPVREPAE